MDRGSLDMLVQIVHAGKTDAVLPEQPGLEHTHHILASEATLAAMKAASPHVLLCFIHTTKHVVLAALRRGRLPLLQELHPDAGDHDAGPLCSSTVPSTTWS